MINLSEKDMVVLKRNDLNDRNVVDKEYPDANLYLDSGNNLFVFHIQTQTWKESNLNGEEEVMQRLKPIEREMKEYLNANHELITVSKDHPVCADWIEIPEGAEIAINYGKTGKILFWKDSGLKHWSEKELNSGKYEWLDCEDNHKLNAFEFAREWAECSKFVWTRSETKKVEGEKSAGLKYDSDKPRYSLLPKGTVNSVVSVLEFGAKKYEANNWQKVANAKERYYNAAMRHIDLWWNCEKRDPETNIHHLAHAATNLFFLMWFDENS